MSLWWYKCSAVCIKLKDIFCWWRVFKSYSKEKFGKLYGVFFFLCVANVWTPFEISFGCHSFCFRCKCKCVERCFTFSTMSWNLDLNSSLRIWTSLNNLLHLFIKVKFSNFNTGKCCCQLHCVNSKILPRQWNIKVFFAISEFLWKQWRKNWDIILMFSVVVFVCVCVYCLHRMDSMYSVLWYLGTQKG